MRGWACEAHVARRFVQLPASGGTTLTCAARPEPVEGLPSRERECDAKQRSQTLAGGPGPPVTRAWPLQNTGADTIGAPTALPLHEHRDDGVVSTYSWSAIPAHRHARRVAAAARHSCLRVLRCSCGTWGTADAACWVVDAGQPITRGHRSSGCVTGQGAVFLEGSIDDCELCATDCPSWGAAKHRTSPVDGFSAPANGGVETPSGTGSGTREPTRQFISLVGLWLRASLDAARHRLPGHPCMTFRAASASRRAH